MGKDTNGANERGPTAEVVSGVVVSLGVIEDGRHLPAHVELGGFSLREEQRSSVNALIRRRPRHLATPLVL